MATEQATAVGQLRVWWVPQVPMKAFEVEVANVLEARFLLDTLAAYDIFQFQTKVKPDYSNAGGLSVWDGSEWIDWYSTDGEDIDCFTLAQIRESQPQWEGN